MTDAPECAPPDRQTTHRLHWVRCAEHADSDPEVWEWAGDKWFDQLACNSTPAAAASHGFVYLGPAIPPGQPLAPQDVIAAVDAACFDGPWTANTRHNLYRAVAILRGEPDPGASA